MFNWQTASSSLGIIFLIIWEMFWKGMGLWRSAKAGDKLWFLAIFVINFFGIIPIVYLWRTKQLETTINDTLKFLRLKQ